MKLNSAIKNNYCNLLFRLKKPNYLRSRKMIFSKSLRKKRMIIQLTKAKQHNLRKNYAPKQINWELQRAKFSSLLSTTSFLGDIIRLWSQNIWLDVMISAGYFHNSMKPKNMKSSQEILYLTLTLPSRNVTLKSSLLKKFVMKKKLPKTR